jgi:hypothetical protein
MKSSIVTWDSDKNDYISIIEPGAMIAEGAVALIDLPADAPGQGKQLTLPAASAARRRAAGDRP